MLAFAGALGLAALFTSGCATGQATATGEAAVGDAWSTYELGKVDPSPAGTAAQKQAVALLQRVSTDVSAFANGTLSQQELGAITETLNEAKLNVISNVKATDQLNQILQLLQTQVVVGPGGTVSPIQALEVGAVNNIKVGIANAISYFEGKWSVSNPAVWPATSALVRPMPAAVAMDMYPVYRFNR